MSALKSLSLCLALLWCCALPGEVKSQSEARKSAISDQLEQFFQATQEKDWNQVLDLTYPKLFELVPREQMMGVFQSMTSEGMNFDMSNMKILRIYGAEDHETETFSAVDYSMKLKIMLSGESFNDQALDFMKTSFETTYGADKVNLDRENKTFIVEANKTLLAIATVGKNDWHFIEKNAEQMMILEQLVPEEVLGKF